MNHLWLEPLILWFKIVPNMKENSYSAPWFQSILAFLLTLGWLWLQKTVGRDYLGGFQPSALLTLQNQRVLEPDVLSVCHWEAQMISAPFCASPRKGKEWHLGTNSLSQMPWGNLQIKHRHALVQFVEWNKVNLVFFIFKSIFYS